MDQREDKAKLVEALSRRARRRLWLLVLVLLLHTPLLIPAVDLAFVLIIDKPTFANKTDMFFDGGSRQHHGMYYTIWDGRYSQTHIGLKLMGVEVIHIPL